jgi:hypothetical protein
MAFYLDGVNWAYLAAPVGPVPAGPLEGAPVVLTAQMNAGADGFCENEEDEEDEENSVRPRTRPVELSVTDTGQVRGGAFYGSGCSHDCVGRHRTLRQQAAPCALTPSGAGHNIRGKPAAEAVAFCHRPQ